FFTTEDTKEHDENRSQSLAQRSQRKHRGRRGEPKQEKFAQKRGNFRLVIRRHGEDQNQFSPHIRCAQCRLRTQRGTEENWKPKACRMRRQRRIKAMKFAQKMKKFAISNPN